MAPAFPVPRAQLPRVRVSNDERAIHKQDAQRFLQHTLSAFDDFAHRRRYRIDAKRWKQETSRDRLKLWKERKPSSEAEGKRAFILSGETSGRVEDALFAFSCESHAEHALLTQFLYADVVDCSVLRPLEGGACETDPYRSLAFKWFAKASGMGKSRDVVYLEFSGTTLSKIGEELGFHVLQTVELAAFPEFRDRHCARTPRGESMCTIFRQSSDNTVEVFTIASLAGAAGRGVFSSSSSSSASLFSPDELFALASDSIKCGETKRLTMLIDECRHLRASQSGQQPSMYDYHEEAVLCSMCRQEKKTFNSVTLTECEVCSATICNKCRENRQIFVYEGHSQVGRFEKVSCCQTCAFNAVRLRPEIPAWAKRELSSTSSSEMISATHLQLRSGSVASTVPSDVASSDAFGVDSASVHTSAFAADGDDELGRMSFVNESLTRLSLDRMNRGTRVSVDSVDGVDEMTDRPESRGADINALVVSTKRSRSPRPSAARILQTTPHVTDPQVTHQMQLYMRMQQLTQQAELTYQTTRQQIQPQPQTPVWSSRPC